MKEDFLQFIWKMQLFQPTQLRTIYYEKVVVLKPGVENRNEGPDFLEASIEIQNQLWAGHVEIHKKSSDWYVHLHQLDPNYDATILHVVWEYDVPVYSPGKVEIPTVELKQFVSQHLLEQYRDLFHKKQKWINCENLIRGIDPFRKDKWLEALYFERLHDKTNALRLQLAKTQNNWEEVLFWVLAKNFGLKINGNNFLEIAQSIPFHVLRKLRNSEIQLQAVLFGQAGLLIASENTETPYYSILKEEYKFLKNKFKLVEPLKCKVHFFRLRPSSFPTIRLSQLGQLYFKTENLFRQLMESTSMKEIEEIFKVSATEFWKDHYTFRKKSEKVSDKRLTKSFIDLVVLNTLMPLKFLYELEKGTGNDTHFEIAESMQAEKNTIISKFKALEIEAKNAMQSQALIQMKTTYCDQGKCLRCAFGTDLLKNQS